MPIQDHRAVAEKIMGKTNTALVSKKEEVGSEVVMTLIKDEQEPPQTEKIVEVIKEVIVEKIVEVPAPTIQLPLEDRIQKVEDLTMLIERYKTLSESRRKLQTFHIGADGMSSAIALKDAVGNEFKTSNSAVISAVIETMKNILDGKIQDVQEQISF